MYNSFKTQQKLELVNWSLVAFKCAKQEIFQALYERSKVVWSCFDFCRIYNLYVNAPSSRYKTHNTSKLVKFGSAFLSV